MTFAAVTLLGMTMGQPQGADIYPMNSRTIKLPIVYKEKDRKQIRYVRLFVARNGENVWYQEASVTPDKDAFVHTAKEDGEHWYKMQIEYLNGALDPPVLTQDPPDLKVVIDTAPPVIRVTNAKRSGNEIVIEWAVDDKFLNDAQTKVEFCPAGDPAARWRPVDRPPPAHPGERFSGVKFACGTADGITVRVTAADFAGNRTEVLKEYPAAGPGQVGAAPVWPNPPITAPTTPVTPAPPSGVVPVQNTQGAGVAQPADVFPAVPAGPIPPPVVPPVSPAGPVGPGSQQSGYLPPPSQTPFSQPPASGPPSYVPPPNPAAGGAGGPSGSAQPLATVDPKEPPATAAAQGAAPANWSTPAAGGEGPRAQFINYPRFDLGFDLEQHGPSGIGRVDLYVTRDEGKSWRKWKEYDGKGGAVRVSLDVPPVPQQMEGSYGFRLVPVSGAGLSESAPGSGVAPEMRVVLDVTPPQVELWPLLSDPNNPDTLLIKWVATDRNFGEEPITLEWSESAAGPWHPIASGGGEPVVQATAVNVPAAPKRLANTGQYGWRVPANTPARVYLKVTARDAAGNLTERVTKDPQTVDLTKPRAKINGIVPSNPQHP
jgi:hypothetical protein